MRLYQCDTAQSEHLTMRWLSEEGKVLFTVSTVNDSHTTVLDRLIGGECHSKPSVECVATITWSKSEEEKGDTIEMGGRTVDANSFLSSNYGRWQFQTSFGVGYEWVPSYSSDWELHVYNGPKVASWHPANAGVFGVHRHNAYLKYDENELGEDLDEVLLAFVYLKTCQDEVARSRSPSPAGSACSDKTVVEHPHQAENDIPAAKADSTAKAEQYMKTASTVLSVAVGLAGLVHCGFEIAGDVNNS